MKAISLWQPWATAIALGSKTIETRHWETKYRGRLAIHAAKRCNLEELEHIAAQPCWRGALHPITNKLRGLMANPRTFRAELPFGALVATCTIVDCRPSESFPGFERWANPSGSWTNADMGDFSPGRFGWMLEDIEALPAPIPWRGGQGFFEVPDVTAARILAERERQVDLGWTPAHDDQHVNNEIETAAHCYLTACRDGYDEIAVMNHWPWEMDSFRPGSASRNMVKAGALLLAEQERIERSHLAYRAGVA